MKFWYALVALTVFISGPAFARWYAGGAIGAANSDITSTREVPYSFSDYGFAEPDRVRTLARRGSVGGEERKPRTKTESYQDDETELAFRLFGGYDSIISNDSGRFRVGAELGYANLGDFSGDTETDALDLTATLRIGLGSDWGLLGRAGVAYWDAVDDGIDGTAAVGITRNLGPANQLRLEAQHYQNANDGEDVNAVFLGISRHF